MNAKHQILKQYFGYNSFRPHQEEIIDTILEGRSCLVLMPTGGGKSICYQVPALLIKGIAIVISPLIALMKDQVESLRQNGVDAAFLNSSLSPDKERFIINDCLSGKIRLLYLSPEKAITLTGFLSSLQVSLIAIDEAHCISQWGHDFRPEYGKLTFLTSMFPNTPVIALTATADKVTRKDIIRQLSLENSRVFVSSFDRPNLRLDVLNGLRKKEKLQEIVKFINRRKDESGIIYCMTRKLTEEVAAGLIQEGIPCGFYHAGMDADARNKIQEGFIKDDIKIICATIAFGMGIDKSNIRWIIHYNLPKNMEGYYQEIGRAGRDGLKSDTLLFYNLQDLMMLSKFATDSGQPELNRQKLNRMQQYAEARVCRRRILLSYFGDHFNRNCNNCDVCSNPPTFTDGTTDAQKALSASLRTGEQIGTGMLINILRGSKNHDLLEKKYDTIKTYGSGKNHSYEHWQHLLMQFIQLGLFEIAYDEGYVLKVTPHGHQVVKGLEKVEITEAVRAKLPIEEVYSIESEESTDNHLFNNLRALRKYIADSEGVAPYLIFTDKSLREMSMTVPETREEMLAVQGVSKKKYDKYGKIFLEITGEFAKSNTIQKPKSIEETLPVEMLKKYIHIMHENRMRVSYSALGKILTGAMDKNMPEEALSLTFYGLLKNNFSYKTISPYLKEHLPPIYKPELDKFFHEPIYNNLTESELKPITDTVSGWEIMRPSSEITNDYILEQRKQFPRAYEPWSEPEIELFNYLISKTNNLDLISQLLMRNQGSITSFFKKNILQVEKLSTHPI